MMTKASLIVEDLGVVDMRSARAWSAMAIYQEELAVVHSRSWLGCGARCVAPRPLAAAVRRLRRDARAGRVRGSDYGGDEPHYLLAAKSWSTTATSTCATSTRLARTTSSIRAEAARKDRRAAERAARRSASRC